MQGPVMPCLRAWWQVHTCVRDGLGSTPHPTPRTQHSTPTPTLPPPPTDRALPLVRSIRSLASSHLSKPLGQGAWRQPSQRSGLTRHVSASAVALGESNGAGEYDFDLFTIGAGSGGVRASRMAASNHGGRG